MTKRFKGYPNRIRSYSQVRDNIYDKYVSFYKGNEAQAVSEFIGMEEYIEKRRDFYKKRVADDKECLKKNLEFEKERLVNLHGQNNYKKKTEELTGQIDNVFNIPVRGWPRLKERVHNMFDAARIFYSPFPRESRNGYLHCYFQAYKVYQSYINLTANYSLLSWMITKILDSGYSYIFNSEGNMTEDEKNEIAREEGVGIWNVKPHQDVIDQRFKKLKEDMLVRNAFEALKKELVDEGLDPQEYLLKDDAHSFNRGSNKRLAKLYRNKSSRD